MRTQEEAMELYYEHENLIYATVYRRFNSRVFNEAHGFLQDDLIQYGREGLYHACKTYDPDKNTKFTTHAFNHIYWSITNNCRTNSLGSINTINFDLADRDSFDRVIETDKQGVQRNLYELIEDKRNLHQEVEDDIFLEQAYETISDHYGERLADFIRLRAEGYSFPAIGEMYNVSRQAVTQAIRSRRNELAELLHL